MKLTDIVDPTSGDKLFSFPIPSDVLNHEVTNILVTEDLSRYYFEIKGVVYLSQHFRSYLDCNEFFSSNIPKVVNEEALNWYKNYRENFGSFKFNEFSKFFDGALVDNMKVLDFISADGNIIDILSERAKHAGKAVTFFALDLDFHALKSLKLRQPEVICVCCDATKKAFRTSTFDLVFSNSIHHVPKSTETVFANISEMLNLHGVFSGVESQGLLAKLVVFFISLLPKFLIPNSISEIYNERKLLRSWLSSSLIVRCRSIEGFHIVKHTLFHCFYQIKKNCL
jgi:hypothetical protein